MPESRKADVFDRLQYRIRAGHIDRSDLALPITRQEAREILEYVYDDVRRDYFDAMRLKSGDYTVTFDFRELDFMAELRRVLRTGDVDEYVSAVDIDGVPLKIVDNLT